MTRISLALLFLCSLLLFGCAKNENNPNVIKVAATPVPQAQMLAFAAPMLQKEGFELKVITMDDYNLPNRALADGDVDANFFQHKPFLEQQIQQFHYDICILTAVHIEPMGIYSEKISTLNELQEGAIISLPNDPTNESRALLLLEKEGVLTLSTPKNGFLTVRDVIANPKKLKFQEIDAATLSRTLPDVSAAIIPTNFALQAKILPTRALVLEERDSPYANIIAIRCQDAGEPKLDALKRVMTSEQMYNYIETTYQGSIIPSFHK